MSTIEQIRAIPDSTERARAASALLTEREAEVEAELRAIRDVRDDAARAMFTEGQRAADVARALGISRAAVSQRFGPAPVKRVAPARKTTRARKAAK